MNNTLKIDLELLDSISQNMINKGFTVSVAESCTGGFISTFLTLKSGASSFFKGSLVNYSDESKINLLGVEKKIIKKYGVVSKNVVEKMAKNVRLLHSTDYGLATTGYVDLYNAKLNKQSSLFHAWIGVSSKEKIMSRHIVLKKNRLDNIVMVGYSLLKVFRKEIL